MNPLVASSLITAGSSLLGGMLGGGGSQSQQTTTNAPWSAIQPQVLAAINGAAPLAGTPRQFYPDSTVAPVSDYTMAGMQGAAGRAMGPSLSQAASNMLPSMWGNASPVNGGQLSGAYSQALSGPMRTAAGDQGRFMAGNPMMIGTPEKNPYLDSLFQQGADQVQARMGSIFGQGGRLNSGAHARATAEQLGNTAESIYGAEATRQADRNLTARQSNQAAMLTGGQALMNNEASMRNSWLQGLGLAGNADNQGWSNALRAMSMAPDLEAASYLPYQQMMNLGGMDQANQQRFIDADRQRFDHYQNEPWQRVGDYLGLIGYGTTGYNTQSTPIYRDDGANIAAGLLGVVPDLVSAYRNRPVAGLAEAQADWSRRTGY